MSGRSIVLSVLVGFLAYVAVLFLSFESFDYPAGGSALATLRIAAATVIGIVVGLFYGVLERIANRPSA